MNYLAHTFLAGTEPEAVLGGLLGDFVKGKIVEQYTPAIRQAILLHRRIDLFTDAHSTVRASRRLVSSNRRRFAGIMVDIYYDHFLARHWVRYTSRDLSDFTRMVYDILWRYQAHLPERLRGILPHMSANDWLGAYADKATVGTALDGIARRFKRPTTLVGGGQELEDNYSRFEAHFLDFFPELIRFAMERRDEVVVNS